MSIRALWNQLRGNVLPIHADARERGNYGEDLALDFLKREKKFKILSRNWRSKNINLRGEIDIIGLDGDVLVFIEVKTRSSNALVPGYYTVTDQKKNTLRKTCKAYLREVHKRKHFRFDIVEVKLCQPEPNCVKHYSNIPLFSQYFQS